MKVFLSWSGVRSKYIADSLRKWLPRVIQAAKPWMSDLDIPAGARWQSDVANELDEANFGILCVTPENMNKPWLMFEAGALSKSMKASHVCPLVYSMELGALSGPIGQFQANLLDEDGVFQVLKAINAALPVNSLDHEHLKDQFDTFWPRLQQMLQAIPPEVVQSSPVTKQPFTSIEAALDFLQAANIRGKNVFTEHEVERPGEVNEKASAYKVNASHSLMYAPISTVEGAIAGLTPKWNQKNQLPTDEDLLKELISEVNFDLDRWNSAGFSIPTIALDLSGWTEFPRALIDALLAIGTKYPKIIEIGVSETLITQNYEGFGIIGDELRSAGLLLSVRDFGTGYMSLSHLQRIPLDTLWISKAFIAHLSDERPDDPDVEIVAAIVSIGKDLDLNIIAEGVSNAEQIKLLLDVGVKTVSGSVAGDLMNSEDVFRKMSS